MARSKKEQPSFEQLMQELEQTVAQLEQGNYSLEEILRKYGEGVELLRACQGILEKASEQLPEQAQEDNLWT